MTPALFEGLERAGPLFTLAIVILVGLLAGAGARRLRLPGITGQILIGVVLGRSGLDLFGDEALHALQPITHFALGLMAVTIGAHLNLRRLRNAGRRLFILLLTEATITPVVVYFAITGFTDTPPGLAVLFATCAIATAPATTVALVSEARARGVFVKTLIAAVALNNMACVFLFEVARSVGHAEGDAGGWLGALVEPGRELLVTILIGGSVALALEALSRFVVRPDRIATAAMVSIVLTSGTADFLGVSPLLACLFLGFVQTNISRDRDKLVDTVFADFQPAILAVFFMLAGMHLSFGEARLAGLLALLFFVSRAVGKYTSGRLAMKLAAAPKRVRQNLGLALVPQAGVAVALVILVQDDPALSHWAELFSAVVLTVVAANEILGPILTRIALNRSGEVGKDRLRLLDFIQEENIVTDFQAESKEEALERLVDLMISSQHMPGDARGPLLESVLAREGQGSTCLGGGLAVPHGILPEGHSMVGMLAVSREGLAIPTPDGVPVHCMVLLGTSPEERDRHLQVLAALARTVGMNPTFRARLIKAKSPAHASELLHGDESEGFNYFLEE